MSNVNQHTELSRLASELNRLRESACQSGNCMKAPEDAKNGLLLARAKLVLALQLPANNLVTSIRQAINTITQNSQTEDLPS